MRTSLAVAACLLALGLTACGNEQDPGLQPGPAQSEKPSDEPNLGNLGDLGPVEVISLPNDKSPISQFMGATEVPDQAAAEKYFSASSNSGSLMAAWTRLSKDGTVWFRSVGDGCLPPLEVTAQRGSGVPVIFKVKYNPANKSTQCLVAVTHVAMVAVPN